LARRLRLGDAFSIPLEDGRTAYGQYVFRDRETGPLVKVFDLFTVDSVALPDAHILATLPDCGTILGPVLAGVGAATRTGLWPILGNLAVRDFSYPGFLNVFHEGFVWWGNWYFWNGEYSKNLGQVLPAQYAHTEFLAVWDPQTLAHLIATGENPYGEMVRRAALGEDSS